MDIDAGDALVEAIKPLAKSTERRGVMGGLGGFGALFDLKAAGFTDPVLVSSTDGVGTKLRVAIDAGLHDTVGIDLVAMCVNDLVVQGAEPLFFLDYFATGKLRLEVAKAVIAGIAEGCRQAGCALVGGETAEMPGMYAEEDYDLAGFSVGAAERDGLLPQAGRGAGRRAARAWPAPGVHSNGFSLVRRIVEAGGMRAGRRRPSLTASLGEALLAPTRIYVKSVLALHQARAAEGGGAYHRRRPAGQPAAGAARRAWRRWSMPGPGPCRRSSAGSPGPATWRRRRCCGSSTAASAWWWWSQPRRWPRRPRCWRAPARRCSASGQLEAGSGEAQVRIDNLPAGWPR